eukprot:COSAG06_NODE_52454_length_305_cov_1.135922_2_plen_34_part_01
MDMTEHVWNAGAAAPQRWSASIIPGQTMRLAKHS